MLFVSDAKIAVGPLAAADLDHKLVQQDFAKGVGGSEPASDDPHGPIAVAAQRGLNHRKIEFDATEPQ